jgi:hypothetical protein
MGVRRDKAALSSGCKPHPALRSSRKQPDRSLGIAKRGRADDLRPVRFWERHFWPRDARKLAAILALDVAGYSRLMGADEEGRPERSRQDPGACRGAPRLAATTLARHGFRPGLAAGLFGRDAVPGKFAATAALRRFHDLTTKGRLASHLARQSGAASASLPCAAGTHPGSIGPNRLRTRLLDGIGDCEPPLGCRIVHPA